jgi:hypothetical protein
VIWGRQMLTTKLNASLRFQLGDVMFKTKLNVVVPVLGVIIASIQPAFAVSPSVPAPIIGAGLPALAVLAGGYWLVRKLRRSR